VCGGGGGDGGGIFSAGSKTGEKNPFGADRGFGSFKINLKKETIRFLAGGCKSIN